MNSSATQTRHVLFPTAKSGQKYTNIHTKWTNFKSKQVYLPFPCHQRTQYYPQAADFNIESLTCQFCCIRDTSALHQTGNPCEGKSQFCPSFVYP